MSGSPKARKREIHPLRDALLAGCVTLLVSAIGLFIVYVRAYHSQLEAARSELLQIARTTVTQVDGDLHERVVAASRDGTPEHLRALAPLVRAHAATRDVYDIYTGIERNGHVYWILDSRRGLEAAPNPDADPIMTEYNLADPDVERVFVERTEIANTEPRHNEDGHTYLSALVPFNDSDGNLAGILGIDMVLDALEARMADIRRAVSLAIVAVLLLSAGAGWVAWRIRRFTASIVSKLRTARAEAESNARAAQAASRAKADFLAMMSHEIRTPMNGVLGVADLLRGMTRDPEQTKLLSILSASGKSLLTIINDILDFSKIEAARLELHSQPFDLRLLLDEVEHLLAGQARAKGLVLRVHVDPALPAALDGDRQRLSQVLMNLGTNAVKFTERGEVRIEARLLERVDGRARVRFSIRDTGIGISKSVQPNLFSPFTQFAASRQHRTGTGLGLVISQRLINFMGGEISASSVSGVGSTFEFAIDLPVAEAADPTPLVAESPVEPLSVLVAEDNAVNQTIITAMLQRLGHAVTVVPNGQAALDALARADFELVLMDCNMPVMDGLEATRALRRGDNGVRDPRVRVVALTANALAGDREKCLAAGMDEFLAKPVSMDALRETIERVRALPRAA